MITSIQFLSLEEFLQVEASPQVVVVSVLDHSEAHRRPALTGFGDVLALEFEDAWEDEGIRWPDDPTPEQHTLFAGGLAEVVPSLAHARDIHAFVMRHHRSAKASSLVVHCYGGISRSAAIAQWFASVLWVPLSNPHERDTDHANPRLLRLLDKASGRS